VKQLAKSLAAMHRKLVGCVRAIWEASLCPEVVVTPTAWQWPAPLTQDNACLHMTAGAAQRVKTFVLCGYQRMAALLLLTVVLCMGLCMIAECIRAVFLCFCLATFFWPGRYAWGQLAPITANLVFLGVTANP
jgi:hypothetical protein